MSTEVLIEKGRAPYKFETGNAESPFLRTLDPADNGKEHIYWGSDLPRAAASIQIGDIITAKRVESKPVTLTHQEKQSDGTQKDLETEAKRNKWEVTKHGHNSFAVLAAYNARVDSPEARRQLEKFNPGLVKARDEIVSAQKRERLQREQQAQQTVKRHGRSL